MRLPQVYIKRSGRTLGGPPMGSAVHGNLA